jgi:hypothetical protein
VSELTAAAVKKIVGKPLQKKKLYRAVKFHTVTERW